MSQPEALQDIEFHRTGWPCLSLKYQIQLLMEAGARGLLMEIAARPVEEDSKPDQGCPIQDHTHHIVLKWCKCDFKSGLAQTQHPPAVGIPVLETLLKLRIATLMVCLFISPTFFYKRRISFFQS